MDVDLSTDLDALLPLVAPLLSGHSDVAIGTRLASNARVVRGPKRELISRGYNLILRTTLRAGFSDAQCGFKAVRADVARELLPLVEDQGWFFDTELLRARRAQRAAHPRGAGRLGRRPGVTRRHRAHRDRRPARRVADDPSLRTRRRRARALAATHAHAVDPRLGPQVVKFASIGVVSTVVFAALFALLDGPLGAIGADVIALLVCAFANTAANRRLTFALRGRAGRVPPLRRGHRTRTAPARPHPRRAGGARPRSASTSLAVTLVTLTAANLLATTARFLLLRNWVFRP